MYSHTEFSPRRTPFIKPSSNTGQMAQEKVRGGPPGLRTASLLESNQMVKSAASVLNIPSEVGPRAGSSMSSPILTLTLEGKYFCYRLTDEETKSQGPTLPLNPRPINHTHIPVTDKATAALPRAVNKSRSACPQGGLLPRKYFFSITVWKRPRDS